MCCGRQSSSGDRAAYFRFRSAVDVTNCLLLTNFASNVILYCAINAHFRRVVRHIFWVRVSSLFLCRNRRALTTHKGVEATTVLMKPTTTQNAVMMRTHTVADVVEL